MRLSEQFLEFGNVHKEEKQAETLYLFSSLTLKFLKTSCAFKIQQNIHLVTQSL
jgi:hypothetical protein